MILIIHLAAVIFGIAKIIILICIFLYVKKKANL